MVVQQQGSMECVFLSVLFIVHELEETKGWCRTNLVFKHSFNQEKKAGHFLFGAMISSTCRCCFLRLQISEFVEVCLICYSSEALKFRLIL